MACDNRQDSAHATLLDGSHISVRQLTTGDVQAVLDLHRHLTTREQYLRFFIAHPAYLDTFAHTVVQCNATQCALGAFESGRLIGVANYVTCRDPHVAECAVAVAHTEHLRGVATLLLQRLATTARANGIGHFTAEVLADNSALLQMIAQAGWRHTTALADGVLTIGLDLSTIPDPHTPGSINAARTPQPPSAVS